MTVKAMPFRLSRASRSSKCNPMTSTSASHREMLLSGNSFVSSRRPNVIENAQFRLERILLRMNFSNRPNDSLVQSDAHAADHRAANFEQHSKTL